MSLSPCRSYGCGIQGALEHSRSLMHLESCTHCSSPPEVVSGHLSWSMIALLDTITACLRGLVLKFQVGHSRPLTDHLRSRLMAGNRATRGGLLPRKGGAGTAGRSAGLFLCPRVRAVGSLPETSEPQERPTVCGLLHVGSGITYLLEFSQNSVLCYSYPQQTGEKPEFRRLH